MCRLVTYNVYSVAASNMKDITSGPDRQQLRMMKSLSKKAEIELKRKMEQENARLAKVSWLVHHSSKACMNTDYLTSFFFHFINSLKKRKDLNKKELKETRS